MYYLLDSENNIISDRVSKRKARSLVEGAIDAGITGTLVKIHYDRNGELARLVVATY